MGDSPQAGGTRLHFLNLSLLPALLFVDCTQTREGRDDARQRIACYACHWTSGVVTIAFDFTEPLAYCIKKDRKKQLRKPTSSEPRCHFPQSFLASLCAYRQLPQPHRRQPNNPTMATTLRSQTGNQAMIRNGLIYTIEFCLKCPE